MATTQYIGSRYVPVLADPVEWSSTKSYDPLTIVTHEGNSYTSRQFVPVGIDITNNDYWALTGNYDAQVELYRRETEQAVETCREYTDAAVEQVDTWLDVAQGQYGAKMFAFATVADMQAAYELLYIGAVCHTNGFNASGDGGAAYYNISASGTANGMDVIALPNNLYAHLVAVAPYTVFSDDWMAYELGIVGYKRFAGINFTVNNTINIGGKHAERKTFTNCVFDLKTDFFTWSTSYEQLPRFENCVFLGNGNALVTQDRYTSGSNFENCIFVNCKFCTSATFVQSPHFINCRWIGSVDFITANAIYDAVFSVCQWESNWSARIMNVTAGGNYAGISCCRFDNCIMEGFSSSVVPFITATNGFDFIFENCYMESIPQLINFASNSKTNVYMSLIITNCKIQFNLNVPLVYIDPSYDKTKTYGRKQFLVSRNRFDTGGNAQVLFNDYTYPNMQIENNSFGNSARFDFSNNVMMYNGADYNSGTAKANFVEWNSTTAFTAKVIPSIVIFTAYVSNAWVQRMVLVSQASTTVKATEIITGTSLPVTDNGDGTYTVDISSMPSTSTTGRAVILPEKIKFYLN